LKNWGSYSFVDPWSWSWKISPMPWNC
jgi:hypothetical protein